MTVYFRDVTGARQAAEALRESEARYRSLFDHSLDGILLTVPTGEILAANPAACRLLQRTEKEICRLGRAALRDPADPRLRSLIEERDRSGAVRAEIKVRRKDGTKVAVEVASAVFTDRDGQHPDQPVAPRSDRRANGPSERINLIAEAGEELSLSLERDEICAG